MNDCQHLSVSVTYQHPHGDVANVMLSDLKTTPPESSRSVMTLASPKCMDCGAMLDRRDLSARICQGGDLYDPRFKFVW